MSELGKPRPKPKHYYVLIRTNLDDPNKLPVREGHGANKQKLCRRARHIHRETGHPVEVFDQAVYVGGKDKYQVVLRLPN